MVKIIYATGLGLSFILSTFTVNYYLKRAQESSTDDEADRKKKKARELESSDDSDEALYEQDVPGNKAKSSVQNIKKKDDQTETEKSMKSVDNIFDKVLLPAV